METDVKIDRKMGKRKSSVKKVRGKPETEASGHYSGRSVDWCEKAFELNTAGGTVD